jgi:signal transduction histidine kinase
MRGRRWAVDAGLAVAVLVVAQIAIVTAREVNSTPRTWFAYALGAAMAAPILVRRRWPVAELYAVSAVLLVFYAVGFPGFPPSLVLAVPLYDVVRSGKLWWALPVPVGFLSIGYAVSVRNGIPPLTGVAAFLPEVAVAAVAMLLGALMRSRQAYAEEVAQRLRQAELDREREAARQVAEERLRIARDLHDTVAHAMTTMTVQSAAALRLLGRDPEAAGAALQAIRTTGKDALAQMRSTLHVLRSAEPFAPQPDAGLDRLADLLDAVRAAGLEVDVKGAAPAVPGAVDRTAYRIVQEALTNVLRHAGPAARATLALAMSGQDLTIEVRDDGAGAAADASGGGHGVIGMRERAEALHGYLEAGPLPDGGYRVRAVLPLEAP